MRTKVGYCGGKTSNPTYQRIGDHTESIDLEYDPAVVSYSKLLDIFWLNHDPTVCRKRQYMSAIFYHDEEQRQLAEESKLKRQKEIKQNIVTKIQPFEHFYSAENYHQKYILQTYHQALFRSLNLSKKDLISSPVATKLNGYVAGYGSLSTFNAECDQLGLSPENIQYVRKQISRGR